MTTLIHLSEREAKTRASPDPNELTVIMAGMVGT
jgi:hypothetical protein